MRVSELLECARARLDTECWEVQGEITGLRAPSASGHSYFSLVDDGGCLQCVVYRRHADALASCCNGTAVTARGRLTVYSAQGRMQFAVTAVQVEGAERSQQKAREELLDALRREGLLSRPPRPIPTVITHMCVITGANSAAAADMRKGIQARWPSLRTTFVYSLVQGALAPEQLGRAFRMAQALDPPPDVIVCGRGGGSDFDLAAFDDELVVRAFAACRIPTVSAVGHETDHPITDLVSDKRAKTPTEAIERIVPDAVAMSCAISDARNRLAKATGAHLAAIGARLARTRRLLGMAPLQGLEQARSILIARQFRITRSCRETLEKIALRCESHRARMRMTMESRMRRERERVASARGALVGLDPRNTLKRGYSLVYDQKGLIVSDAKRLAIGDAIHVQCGRGVFVATVTGTTGHDECDHDQHT